MNKLLLAAALSLGLTGVANAQYPEKPIQVIVPFSAGGATDVVARVFSERVATELGTTLVIQNVAGAGGGLGAAQAAQAAPDGYSLFFATMGALAINPNLYATLAYSVDQFTPISLSGTSTNMLLANNSVEATTLTELIEYAKANPGALTYGTSGVGSSTHLAAELMQIEAGIELLHVPYTGGAQAAQDLLGGQINLMFEAIPNGLTLLQSGDVKTYGTTGSTRPAAAQDIPTLAEEGLDGFDVTIWFAFMAPAGTPQEVIDAVNAAIQVAAADPAVQERLAGLGVEPVTSTPEELAARIVADDEKWGLVIEKAGITIE
jgi:tripartite-type tricarboxylate transporter receptor subunit TctC